MKRMKHLWALTPLLAAASPGASAAQADLLVKGAIMPGAACNVTIDTQAMDLGTIDFGMLNEDADKPTDLAERRVKALVNCANPARYAFVIREAGGADPENDKAFTMRADEGNTSPGNLFLLFDAQSVKIDGSQGYATGASGTTDLEHATWGPSTPARENLPITNGRYAVGFVTSEGSADAPSGIKDLSVYVLVRPRIHPKNELALSDNLGFASNLGLEITYF